MDPLWMYIAAFLLIFLLIALSFGLLVVQSWLCTEDLVDAQIERVGEGL